MFDLVERADWFEWTQAACLSMQCEGEGERIQREIEKQRKGVMPSGGAPQSQGVKL